MTTCAHDALLDPVSGRDAVDRAATGTKPRLAYALAGAGALLFAVNGSVSKVTLTSGLTADRLTLLRSTITWLVLLAVLLVTRPARLRISLRELPFVAIYGVTGVAFTQWFYFIAIERLPVGVALLFEYTAPVMVALWARFVMGEPVRRRMWAALGLALAGLALVAQVWQGLGENGLDGIGVLAGLGAAVALASYFLLGEHGVSGDRARDPVSLTCWTFLFSALFWSVLTPWWTFDPSTLVEPVALPGGLGGVTAPVWALVLWVAVLGTVLPFTLGLAALRHLPATRVAIVAMLEPVGAIVVAWVWLGEALTAVQLFGAAVVLVGIVAAQTARAPMAAPLDNGRVQPSPEGDDDAARTHEIHVRH
jgi:drug/metabolite transporter (DMT)-like permease